MIYELYYWPGIQGRGEFVRLALEEGAAAYVDKALIAEEDGGGVAALQRFIDGADVERPPFVPPFLKAGKQIIGQTPNILLFLGGRLGLAPTAAAGKLWVHQLQLTLADFIVEIHDTHHPLGGGLYYEEQKAEAKRRSKVFLSERLPKFLGYFERVIERDSAGKRWLAPTTPRSARRGQQSVRTIAPAKARRCVETTLESIAPAPLYSTTWTSRSNNSTAVRATCRVS